MPTIITEFNCLSLSFVFFFIHEYDGLDDPAVSVKYITISILHELARVFNCDLLKIKS